MSYRISTWFGVSLVVGFLVWAGCATLLAQSPSSSKGKGGVEVDLKEGQIATVPGTDITIEVRKVIDFTSQGCLGGPIGCPDQVQLKVSRGQESQEVTLFFPRTQLQEKQGVHQADIFGYKITLTAIQGKQVALSLAVDK